MEKKMRLITFVEADVRRSEYVSGRIAGVISVATNQDPGFGYATAVVEDCEGDYLIMHRCMATDEELEVIKKYLWSTYFWRNKITIGNEE